MDHQSSNGILEEFRIEFWDCWRRLPNKAFFFVLLAAWLALFQFLGNSTLGYVPSRSLMVWMYRAYNPLVPEPPPGTVPDHTADAESTDGHGNLVPLVVLALMWWKRKELLAADLRTWSPGMVLVGLGLFLHLLGYGVQQPRISILGLFTGLYGIMGLAWGPDWLRRSFFPFFLFAFSIPLGSMAQFITFPLRLLVTYLVELTCHYVLAIDVLRVGTKLVDPAGHYEYEVAAACSGIRSLVATLALAVVIGFISFRSWWKRILMVASAVPLAVLGNLLRMMTIVIASEIGGRGWGKAVHDGGPLGIFSLLPYVPAFIGLFIIEHYLREPASAKTALKPDSGQSANTESAERQPAEALAPDP